MSMLFALCSGNFIFFLKYFSIEPDVVICINVIADFIVLSFRVFVVLQQMHFDILRFMKQVCTPTLVVTILAVIFMYMISSIDMGESVFGKFIIIVLSNLISVIFLTYMFGLNKSERNYVRQVMLNVYHKIIT